MAIPNFQTLYDRFVDAVEADPDSDLTDFGPFSLLDGFASVAAVAAQVATRRVAQQARDLFVATAEGDALTYLVRDRYQVERQDGESDADLRERVAEWLELAGAVTPEALLFYARTWHSGASGAELEEDDADGVGRLTVESDDDTDAEELLEDLEEDLDFWRPLCVPVEVEVD